MKKLLVLAFILAITVLAAACVDTGDIHPQNTEPAKAPETQTPTESTQPTTEETGDEWESDIDTNVDFSEFETVPDQGDVTEPVVTEPVVTEPVVTKPTVPPESGDEPVGNETEPEAPEETLSPTDKENFQRPLVKP